MRKILQTIGFIAFVLICGAAGANPLAENPDKWAKMTDEMLRPTIRAVAKEGAGSATVIHMKAPVDGKREVIALTNLHVVVEHVFFPPKQKKGKGEKKEVKGPVNENMFNTSTLKRRPKMLPLSVEVYAFVPTMVQMTQLKFPAEILAVTDLKDASADLALIRFTVPVEVSLHSAAMIPDGEVPFRNEPAWSAGAPLGMSPLITEGRFVLKMTEDKVGSITVATSPITSGNSGGGLYRYSHVRSRFELVAVPAAFAQDFSGPVNHIIIGVDQDIIRPFLKTNGFEFILE